MKKINRESLSVFMQTCSQCDLELEEHKTVSSQQTEETRTTIFRQLIRLQRKVGDASDGEFTVLLSYTQQMDKSGLPWHPL